MASNYTTNYELPIWAADDAFLRTRFNDANQKIDAALGMMPYVKIRRMVTEMAQTQVDFDVSDIDFTDYLRVDLFFLTSKDGGTVQLRLNGLTTNHCFAGDGMVSRELPNIHNYLTIFHGINPTSWVSFLPPTPDGQVACVFHSIIWQTGSSKSTGTWYNGVASSRDVTWSGLSSFNFVGDTEIPAGTEIILCGVKK